MTEDATPRPNQKRTEDYRERLAASFPLLPDNCPRKYKAVAAKIRSMLLNGRKYVRLPSVFTPEQIEKIYLYALANDRGGEIINFSKHYLTGRYEFQFYSSGEDYWQTPLPAHLHLLIEIIRNYCFNIRYVRASIIKSNPGCRRQPLHADCADYYESEHGGARSLFDAPYSLLMAMEDNENRTSILIESKKGKKVTTQEITLKRGESILMRGDFRHAGQAYDRVNHRLFIAFGTKKYPNDGTNIGGLTIAQPSN